MVGLVQTEAHVVFGFGDTVDHCLFGLCDAADDELLGHVHPVRDVALRFHDTAGHGLAGDRDFAVDQHGRIGHVLLHHVPRARHADGHAVRPVLDLVRHAVPELAVLLAGGLQGPDHVAEQDLLVFAFAVKVHRVVVVHHARHGALDYRVQILQEVVHAQREVQLSDRARGRPRDRMVRAFAVGVTDLVPDDRRVRSGVPPAHVVRLAQYALDRIVHELFDLQAPQEIHVVAVRALHRKRVHQHGQLRLQSHHVLRRVQGKTCERSLRKTF